MSNFHTQITLECKWHRTSGCLFQFMTKQIKSVTIRSGVEVIHSRQPEGTGSQILLFVCNFFCLKLRNVAKRVLLFACLLGENVSEN